MTSLITNISANKVVLNVNRNTALQDGLLNQLSSGSRVISAATDPASLATGTKLKSDALVLSQAAANAAQIQSELQTADGALSAVSDILTQLKSLAAQSLSGSVDATGQGNIDKVYQKLLDEISNINSSATFNGTSLVDGTFSASVLVGTTSSNTISVDLTSVDITALSSSGGSVSSSSAATTALSNLVTDIDTVAGYRATIGALTSEFQYHENFINSAAQNISAAQSVITDADTAQTQTEFNNASVLTQAGIAALVKAQSIPQDLLRLLQA